MVKLEKAPQGFGRRLETARGGMSRQEFAPLVGVSVNTLGNWEREEREPDLGKLMAISRVLGINLHWLITGEGEMRPGEVGELQAASASGLPPLSAYRHLGLDDTGLNPGLLQALIELYLEQTQALGAGWPPEKVAESVIELYQRTIKGLAAGPAAPRANVG